MKYISYQNNYLKIRFAIENDKSINLVYFGSSKYNWLAKDRQKYLYSFVEAQISGRDINAHHGMKMVKTEYSLTKKYISHKLNDNELVLVTRNEFLEIETHYVFYQDCASFSTWNIVKNISKDVQRLEYISSFYLSGFANKPGKRMDEKYNLWHAINSWTSEAQWVKDSFLHLGLYTPSNWMTVKRYSLNNTGIWSTKDYLPMAVIENERAHQTLLGQVENNGSWHIELGDNEGVYYVAFSGPTFNDNAFSKKLKPNDIFESAHSTIALANDFESSIQQITKARRHIVLPHKDFDTLPIIFNDYMHALWDTQTTELIKPLVDIAASVGCDEFCIDAGWFAKGSDWWSILGKWDVYEDNFPGGFDKVCDYIRSKGMKAGIWFEIEAMGILCPLAKELPDEYFFMVDGKKEIHHSRYQLNFDNPEVYKMVMDAVCKIIDKYNIEYIKNDCNSDGWVGNEANADSLGDGLLKHNRALIRWFKELRERYPSLTIENCGSGGCRMDYEMLKYCQLQSTSDQTDYKKYPYLSSAVLTAAIPEQAAVWAYPVSKQSDEPVTDEVVAMNMVNSILGRIHLASYLDKLTPKQLDLVREGLNYYRSIVQFKKRAVPVYPNGINYFFDPEVIGGLKDDEKIVLCVWNTSGKARKIKVNLKKYNIESIKVVYPNSLETSFEFDEEKGLLYVDCKVPYMGRVFEIKIK